METIALRLHGAGKASLDTFELPPAGDDEILARIICDSLCMSSYKAYIQGSAHKRVPDDIDINPVILGHECCGEIVSVGRKWSKKYSPGDRFALQPQVVYRGCIDGPGYSYPYMGGDATYVVIPFPVMEMDCLLPYRSDTFFYGALAEPYSCVVGSFDEMFHTRAADHHHYMGNREGGRMAILAGGGPMGYAALDYITNCERKPSLVVVTDIDAGRIDHLSRVAETGSVRTLFIKTDGTCNDADILMKPTDGKGYDDILVMAPSASLIETADRLLAENGCLSFFAGPADRGLTASVNFHSVHYNSTHIIGSVGGNAEDMRKVIDMMEKGLLHPSAMISHVGGLSCAAEATANLPGIPGAKKLIYNQISMPLTALADLEELGREDGFYRGLAEIVSSNGGVWCPEAEKYLLGNAPSIQPEGRRD